LQRVSNGNTKVFTFNLKNQFKNSTPRDETSFSGENYRKYSIVDSKIQMYPPALDKVERGKEA